MRKRTDHLVRSILIVAAGVALGTAAHTPHGEVEAASSGADALPQTTLEAQAHAAVSVMNGKIKLVGFDHPVNVLRDYWGVPHIYAQDQQDLYVETTDAADPLRYKTEKGWERMRVEEEEIRIKGSTPLFAPRRGKGSYGPLAARAVRRERSEQIYVLESN